MSRHLAASHPDRALIEGDDCDSSKLDDFAVAGRCTLRPEGSIHDQVAVGWSGEKGIIEYSRNVWYEVEWEGHPLDVVVARGCPVVLRGGLPNGSGPSMRSSAPGSSRPSE